MKSKKRFSGGFTLVEMLIVVAIIAILVAVSIPMVNADLEKAREATDAANERAALAAALADYIQRGSGGNATYFYTADGTVTPITRDEDLLAAGTPGYDYGQSKAHQGSCIRVEVKETQGVIGTEIHWEVIKSLG